MNSIVLRLPRTTDDVTLTVLRITLGIIMFAHGAQKMLAWFGGHGAAWTIEMWEKWFGFHPVITWLVILGEFFSSILLIVGFLTRITSCITALIMLGAIYFVHGKWGFYMNWYNEQGRGEGFEYHLLVLAICLVLMLRGSGKWSLDRILSATK